MSVLTCSISNCNNIMCDTHIDEIGYICNDCKDRFVQWLPTQSPLYLDSREFIIDKLKEFKKIDVPSHSKKSFDLTLVNQILNQSH